MNTMRIILFAALGGVLISTAGMLAEFLWEITGNPALEVIASFPGWPLLGGFCFCVWVAVILTEKFKSVSAESDTKKGWK